MSPIAENPDAPEHERAAIERECDRRLAICVRGAVRTSFVGYGLQALALRELVAPELLLAWAAAVLAGESVNAWLARRVLASLDEHAARARSGGWRPACS